MKLSEKIIALAEMLEDPENDVMVDADQNQECLEIIANAFVQASAVLKKCASDIHEIEPAIITPDKLEELAEIAAAFDQSDDELLQKQASVLDEILFTIASPKIDWKKLEDNRINELKKKYNTKPEHDEMNKVSDSEAAIEKSPFSKEVRPNEAALSARSCPEHAGAQMGRIGEDVYQCAMDGKIFDYNEGYTLNDGTKVPGTSVANQTSKEFNYGNSNFTSRQDKLGQ